MTRLIIFLISTLGAAAHSWHIYKRREPQGRGRIVLMVLRTLALMLVVLLLLDPHLNSKPVSSRNATRVVVDTSLSMQLGGAAQRAQAIVRAQGTQPLSAGSESDSRMLPALQAAAEAGAR